MLNHAVRLQIGVLLTFASSAASGYNLCQINGLLMLPEFVLLTDDKSKSALGLIIGAISLGSVCSFIPGSHVADHFGRKATIMTGCIIMLFATIIGASCVKIWVMFGTRVMLGIGAGFMQSTAPSLISDVAHPRYRNAVTALYQTGWYWGAILSGVMTIGMLSVEGEWSFRWLFLLQALLPTIQLIGLCIIPESPRWLVAKGRQEQALALLADYHGNGDKNDPLVQQELQEIVASISREAAMKDHAGWKAFFKTKGNLHRLSICIFSGIMSEWVGNCVITFYLAPVLKSIGVNNPRAQASVNLGLQIWNAATSACSALASTRFGRRTLWICSMSTMLFFIALITCFSGLFIEQHLTPAGVAVLPMLFLFYVGYNMACSTISVSYTLEILPFYLRSKGISLFYTVDAAAASFSQYVNPIALNALSWKFYFVYLGCLFIFLGVVYFLFPETKDCLWEEISVIFDGPKAEPDSDMILLRNNSVQTELGTEEEKRLEV